LIGEMTSTPGAGADACWDSEVPSCDCARARGAAACPRSELSGRRSGRGRSSHAGRAAAARLRCKRQRSLLPLVGVVVFLQCCRPAPSPRAAHSCWPSCWHCTALHGFRAARASLLRLPSAGCKARRRPAPAARMAAGADGRCGALQERLLRAPVAPTRPPTCRPPARSRPQRRGRAASADAAPLPPFPAAPRRPARHPAGGQDLKAACDSCWDR
jgi:hypothetical protein